MTEWAEAGLARDWVDADGRAHRVDDGVLAAILDTLDLAPPAEAFVTADAGCAVAVPAGFSDGAAELVREDGTRAAVTIAGGVMPGVAAVGYHRVERGSQGFALAVAPARCPALTGRSWAPAVQVPALRGRGRFGDAGALADAARAFGRAGAQALAIGPTHALFPADPTRFSPYSPSSRLFHNVLIGDPGPGAESNEALIDWPSAAAERMARLRQAFETADPGVLAAYRAATPGLEDHARFDALHAHFGGRGWQDWPAAFHGPRGSAVARFAAEHAREVGFHVFAQWLAETSLARAQAAARETMAIGIIADLAVGVDGGGSQAWSRPGELLAGLSIGAPPDPLGPLGQNWGITALSPFAMQRTGFAGFIQTIRVALRHAGGLRIDHALGMRRLWVIPDGGTAADGAYLTMPVEDLLRIVTIEAVRAEAVVIAEDLGTVPPGFRDMLGQRRMYGMRVLPFERDAGGFVPPVDWDARGVAMTGTHDTPTLAGWWRGRDLDWARRLGRTVGDEREGERAALWRAIGDGPLPRDPASPVDAALDAVADAPGALMIVPVEDLIGEEEQPNLPGTTTEHPNWCRRLPEPVETLLQRSDVAARVARLGARRPG
ncbi:MAG TPA: 4-alpha-glucanotransferase [Sphingomonas sp.]|jgi:4-alpha-glucanotransferase